MRVRITFQQKVDSRALYDELKGFRMNVTDLETKVYAYCNDILLAEIPSVLVICDKYGRYDVDISK